MATLVRKNSAKDSRWVIAWYENQKWKSISLSSRKYNQKTAERLKKVVEILLYSRANRIPLPDYRTQKWVINAPFELQKKLANAGLIEILEDRTCGELWEAFMKWKTNSVGESTLKTYRNTEKRFYTVFEKGELILNLKSERFHELWENLGETYARTTVNGTFKQLHALFSWAMKKKWIYEDPLKEICHASLADDEKDRLISLEDYRGLLECCPSQEWRAILALARFCGLRPGEILALRWDDVNWTEGLIVVRSPKTKRHEGKGKRFPPIFPEVREELVRLFSHAENEGKGFVISRYDGNTETNIREMFKSIAQKAGLPVIPKPFNNMRMTRSNEIRERFGEFCERMWIGHSKQVARKHYYKILPKEIKEAAQWITDSEVEEAMNVPNRPNRPR